MLMQMIAPSAVVCAPQRLKALDGWRAVSIAFVILSHIAIQSGIDANHDAGSAIIISLFPLIQGLGYAGVVIFFVISGFVICRGLTKESELLHRVSLSAFYVRRAFRILPPLAVYVLTIFILDQYHLINLGSGSIFRALTFTCNIPVGYCGGWFGEHTWSLSTEEQFYLLIPLVFSTLAMNRTAVLTSFAFVSIGLIFSLQAVGSDLGSLVLAPFFAISVGVVCALNERRLQSFTADMPAALFYVAILVFFLLARALNTRYWAFAQLALPIVVAYPLLVSMTKLPLGAKWLAAPPVLALGRVSYGIYLWQELATGAIPHGGIVFDVLAVGVALAVAFASYFWLERPMIRIGSSLSTRLQHAGTMSKRRGNIFEGMKPSSGMSS